MRIRTTNSKNTTHYAIIYDINKDGKRTTKIYENLGTIEKIKFRAGNKDPLTWLKEYVADLNTKLKEDNLPVIISKNPNVLIEKNKQVVFNGGYLFLQKIYYDLQIDNICEEIKNKHQFKYDLNSILSRLIYGRILYPSSKLSTLEYSKKFLEQPNFELHHIYRALEILAKENDFIQSELYKNSCKYSKRNSKILYYDCTNYFFEIDEDDDLRKYGISKEHRPNPIVQMGLFMDGDGIPLAFNINPGNTNEQETLTPLEEKIIKDFEFSTFVVCTDAGLSSTDNRKFNNTNDKRFITTQSVKKLKKYLKEWVLDKTNWHLPGLDGKVIDISKLEDDKKLSEKFKDKIFYKERWINEDGLEQKMIVTYSIKYRDYQRKIRNSQIQRAQKLIDSKPDKIDRPKQNDFKRFIQTITTTENGEVAKENHYTINEDIIKKEEQYDGFYAVCTNLDDKPEDIIKINKRRWEIEESFMIMKSEFKARPVYLSREDRIKAHFMTCFLALTIFRFLEKKINEEYTVFELVDTLKDFIFLEEDSLGYRPIYTRTDLTDLLHEKFNFRTDYQILPYKKIKKIFKESK